MVQVEDIYSARKRLGLSQEKLAEALGVSRNTISRWERGEFNPTADKLAALERLLAQLEAPAAPEEAPASKEGAVPPPAGPAKAKRWPVVLVCVGIVCSLLIGIASLIGIYSIKQQQNPTDHATPIEEIEKEEVNESLIIEPGTRQPLQP